MLARSLSIRPSSTICYLGIGLALFAWQSADGAAPAEAPKRQAWTTSKFVGTPEKPEPYRVVDAFPKLNFEKPTSVEQLPDSKRMLITEMSGKVYTFPQDAAIAHARYDSREVPQYCAFLPDLLRQECAHPAHRSHLGYPLQVNHQLCRCRLPFNSELEPARSTGGFNTGKA